MSFFDELTRGGQRQSLVDEANQTGGFTGLFAVTNSSNPVGRLTNPFDIGQAVNGKNPDAKLFDWRK